MFDQEKALAYTEDNIQKLDPIEHIRLRPGMYVGGTDSNALHHLIYEVVDNSIDEALAGRCDRIVVTLHRDNRVSVADNGVGIPVGRHRKEGVSTLELVMTQVGAGGKFDDRAYKVSGGLHGVGVSAVNALSARFEAEVKRDRWLWRQRYETGKPVSEVERVRRLRPGEGTGTSQTFTPDFSIMDHNEFEYDTLVRRFREMAFVTRRVHISLLDERHDGLPHETSFYFEGGLRSFVRYLNWRRTPLHTPVHAEREVEITPEGKKPFNIGVELAFQYSDATSITELAFANTIATPDGGSHVNGMRTALTRVINRHARKSGLLREKEANFSGNDTLEGLTAVISIKHPDPQFESQTKVKLLNPEVQGAVSQVLSEAFQEFLDVHPRDARRIVDKCMTSKRAREAARKARDLVRSGPSLLESSTLPGKLADCSSHGPESEIYIVEGDSAGGSAKQGRDRHFQAILPLRGKILNTERARMDKVLDNNEIKAMISALGIGISDELDVGRLRYGRVIIMTDADVDGSHIRTLLLTFFFRHMQALISGGHLYIAQPPIYRLAQGKKVEYIYPSAGKHEAELLTDALKRRKNPDSVRISRYKGLGEMNADQLRETTMDMEKRSLRKVQIDDVFATSDAFEELMGDDVEPRRRFIERNAFDVANLDI